HGLPGTAMPAFGDVLSAREISDLTAYLSSLAPDAWSAAGAAPATVEVPVLPPASPASIEEGRSVYRIMECWACHGIDGSGRGTSAKGLVNELGQTIAPTDFRD